MAEETYQCPSCRKMRSLNFEPPVLVGVKREVGRFCPTCYDLLWEKLIALVGKLPVL